MTCLVALDCLLLFTRDPLDEQVDIVLLEVNVVQRLLGVERAHDVLERDQSVLLVSENSDVFKFAEHPKNLPETIRMTQILFAEAEVTLAVLTTSMSSLQSS